MPTRTLHAMDLVPNVPKDAERRRLKLEGGVIVERAMLDGEWKTVGLSFPSEQFTAEQATAWAKEHGHEGTVSEATGARGDAADVVTVETVRHHDSVGILGSPQVRADGTLLVMGRLAKPGILQYHTPDGQVRRELVTDSTLRDKDWLRSIARAPVTLEHPVRDGALVDVDPDNVDVFGVGDVDGRVEVDADDYVVLRLAARRRDAIEAIRQGTKVELSPGYDCDLDPTPGVHPIWGAYDAIQVGRRCNHVAITDAARGGHDIGIRRDSVLLVQARGDNDPTGGNMDKAKLLALLVGLGMPEADAKRCDSLDDALDVIKSQRADGGTVRELYDELSSDFRKVSKEKDALQGKVDAMSAELEKIKGEKKGDSADPAKLLEEFLAKADERATLLALAAARGVEGLDDLKRADNAGIRLAIVKQAVPTTADTASEDYVRGVMETLTATTADKHADRADDPWALLSRADGKFVDTKTPAQGARRDSDPYRAQIDNCTAAGTSAQR